MGFLNTPTEHTLNRTYAGMTEATCIVTRFKWPEKDVTGSVGRPIPNTDMKYVYCK